MWWVLPCLSAADWGTEILCRLSLDERSLQMGRKRNDPLINSPARFGTAEPVAVDRHADRAAVEQADAFCDAMRLVTVHFDQWVGANMRQDHTRAVTAQAVDYVFDPAPDRNAERRSVEHTIVAEHFTKSR